MTEEMPVLIGNGAISLMPKEISPKITKIVEKMSSCLKSTKDKILQFVIRMKSLTRPEDEVLGSQLSRKRGSVNLRQLRFMWYTLMCRIVLDLVIIAIAFLDRKAGISD